MDNANNSTHFTDPTKRHDFVLLFDVAQGNPNGDPDAGNLPRIDPETMHGLVTDVAIKRKVRDYVGAWHGQNIFIQSKVALNKLILDAFRAIGANPTQIELGDKDEDVLDWFEDNPSDVFTVIEGKLIYSGESVKDKDIRSALQEALGDSEEVKPLQEKMGKIAKALAAAAKKQPITKKQQDEARQRLCGDYYDIRLFGAVLQTGLNAGQVRGPAQVTFARSKHPIFPLDLTITRQARTTSERMKTGSTEMGRKPVVPYGLYQAHGFFNPYFAQQTGVTEEDLALFWRALEYMWEHDRSASRGMMACRGLYVFSHSSPLGNAHAHRLFDRVRVHLNDGVDTPRSFGDYTVEVDDAEMPEGVALNRVCE